MSKLARLNKNKNALVIRDNKLIEARYSLPYLQRVLLFWLVSQINQEDRALKKYSLSVSDLAEMIGRKSEHLYQEMIGVCNSLTKCTIGILDEDKRSYTSYAIFPTAKYLYGDGRFEVAINEDLLPYLVLAEKRNYTSIVLKYALLLKGSYSSRIYELLKQYRSVGSRTIEVSDLRDWLELGQKQYRNYKDLRQRVLEPSRVEIGNMTDISFGYKPIKSGRRFVAIEFKINENVPKISISANKEETDPSKERLFVKLKKHGVTEQQARKLLSVYDDSLVDWAIGYYEDKKSKNPDIGTGYLVRAIEHDYRPQQSLFEKEESEKKERKRIDAEKIEEVLAQAKDYENRCSEENMIRIKDIIKYMSKEERDELVELSISENQNLELRKIYREKGLDSILMRSVFESVVARRYQSSQISLFEYAKKKGANEDVLRLIEER